MHWMEFYADTLFYPGSNTLKPSAKNLLDKVLTYQRMAGGRGFWVTYDFISARDSGSVAIGKSESVVQFLMGESKLSPGWFTVCQPKQLQTPPANTLFYGQLERPKRSVVNIRIQRCGVE